MLSTVRGSVVFLYMSILLPDIYLTLRRVQGHPWISYDCYTWFLSNDAPTYAPSSFLLQREASICQFYFRPNFGGGVLPTDYSAFKKTVKSNDMVTTTESAAYNIVSRVSASHSAWS